jgi:hypothetical protein
MCLTIKHKRLVINHIGFVSEDNGYLISAYLCLLISFKKTPALPVGRPGHKPNSNPHFISGRTSSRQYFRFVLF